MQADIDELSQAYSSTRFGVDAPAEPANLASILLSMIVILPEVVAMMVLAIEPRR